MSMTGGRLPFPGLRSFTREETDLFFGREGCVDDMVDRLADARFLAVLGASGSGKSSLVKTGLLDALEIGLLHQAGSRWVIADFRPGDRPIHNMAEGLIKATSPDANAQPDEEEVRLLRTFLARGPRSVVEWCEAGNLPEGANLLLLVDQFEELFRYGAYAEREEAEAFVALLLESAKALLSEARIYVVITMRSEFLGAAALIDGLAEAINKGLYLTPRMGRDQVREAIVGPAAVCGFTIEPALVNRLLNDLTSFAPWEEGDTGHQLERLVRRADQLPLMQHVLNRLWSLAALRDTTGPIMLRLADYDRLGGLRGALAAHGREILDELLPEHREIAATVFRALTAGSSLAEAVRRPTEFGELVAVAGGDEIAVREIVEAFRAPGRNFLVPARPTALRPNTLIDISHESLIRQWDEFAQWLQREITSADTWRRLVDAAERYRRNEANLISGLTLASIANWWDTERPTAAWAKRYGGDFASAAAFLDESRSAEAAEKTQEVEERRQKSRNRFVTFAAIVILCIVTPLTIFAGYSAIRANREADAAEAAREEARQAAEEARGLAERQGQAATAARQAEAQAAFERERAETAAAQAEEERKKAVAAQQDAITQAATAVAERQRADEERQKALDAVALAKAESERADKARERAQLTNLQRFADHVASLQQDGAWESAANFLGALWQEVSGTDTSLRQSWMIKPVVEAFRRQELAEYPVYPSFLNYSGFTGWTGTYGRFRVYDLDRKAADGSTVSGNNIMGVFDAVTGAVTGTFELPNGLALGSELDLVAPDGRRAAIITSDSNADDQVDDRQVALWSEDQSAPTLFAMPSLGGDVDLAQLAPVHTDARFGLYFTNDSNPGEIAVADPAVQGISFSMTPADLATAASLEDVTSLNLLGLVDGRLIALVNSDKDGRVFAVDSSDGTVKELASGGGVTSAALTPGGGVLLTVSCPEPCSDQDLTAFDVREDKALWVERIPSGFALTENAIEETTVGGAKLFSALVQNKGAGLIFEIPPDHPDQVTRRAAEETVRMDETTTDGAGGYLTVDTDTGEASADGVDAAGALVRYRIPLARQKLNYYVAPNSLAVYEGGSSVRLAGVTYDGNLVVYRMRPDGTFEDDPNFRPVAVGVSNCIAAVGFGGDGNSLLVRHVDGYLRTVTSIRGGPEVDWRDVSGPAPAPLLQAPRSTTDECPAPDTSTDVLRERIVAADAQGMKFALLDKTGAVFWIGLADQVGGKLGATASARDIVEVKRATPATGEECREGQESDARHCNRAGSGVTWIAGDPGHGRAALVSAISVDIVPYGMATSGQREVRTTDNAPAANVTRTEADATAERPAEGPQKLTRRGEAKAAAFDSDGNLAVVYAEGQLALFAESTDGWTSRGEVAIPRVGGVDTLLFSGGHIAFADDHDFVLGIDPAALAIVGYGRAPASPSAYALKPDGGLLALEWDTDSISTVGLSPLRDPAKIERGARLLAMRSTMRHESEPSLDSLIVDHRMEMSLAATEEAPAVDCDTEEARYLASIEGALIGGAPERTVLELPRDCANQVGSQALQAADLLAERAQTAGLRQLVADGAFSPVLAAAAADDAIARRILGAVLARNAVEQGKPSFSAIAMDAIRLGSTVPAAILKAFAAGAPMDAELVDVAREHAGADPAVHQLIAHFDERQINEVDSLTDALFEFSLAEQLYRQGGHETEAAYVAERRAQLARVLPDKRVLEAMARLLTWKPPSAPKKGVAAALADLPSDPAERHALDIANSDRVLPNSPLLEGLRAELKRARIFDLRNSDPQAAAAMLIDLGKESGGDSTWSADLVREYLTLAEDMSGDSAGASAFRLASEAMKMIGIAYKTPIHADADTVELYRRAADLITANIAAVPRDAAAAAIGAIDFSLVKYQYGTLPGIGSDAEITAGEQLLEATARMAEAIAPVSDDLAAWKWFEGEALFWQGVLLNDHDATAAAPVLQKGADLLRPLVEAKGDDVAARFRFAEVLRWLGSALPSNADTEAIEREAVSRYQALWNERSTFDAQLVADIGAGYGYALANLGQTVRETNLTDVSGSPAAEDHVRWFLEILALAKEKDELNTALIDAGAATGDSGFVNGWYRMSSYGWAMGYLAGLVAVERGTGTVTQCDLLAADPYDPKRRAPGVVLGADTTKAEAVCRAETVLHPEDSLANYQLAHVISADTTRQAEFLPIAKTAAEQGSSAAFVMIAYALGQKSDDRSGDTYNGAAQRTILESFPILYPFLQARATTEREQSGLAWYALKAANLGMPEAQLALAKLATNPHDALFRTKLAARLFSEQGNEPAAASARRLEGAIFASADDVAAVDAEVAAWTAETLIQVPADLGAS